MTPMRARQQLASLELPVGDAHDLPSSPLRFPDDDQYRVEIPSVEGPATPPPEDSRRIGRVTRRNTTRTGCLSTPEPSGAGDLLGSLVDESHAAAA